MNNTIIHKNRLTMNPTLIVTFFILLFASTVAIASPQNGQYPSGMCTRDINPWGHASQCSCEDDELYDARAGLCLKGTAENEKIMVQGLVSTGMVAIGGETTGIALKTSADISYELIVKVIDQEKLQKLNGMWFEVEGDVINIISVERDPRRAIIVETLNVLE